MSDIDEGMLTAAKLAEQLAGNIETERDLDLNAGAISPSDVSASVFLDGLDPDTEDDSELLSLVDRTLQSRQASEAIRSGNSLLLSHLVGVTEQDLDASALTLPVRIIDLLKNNGALTTILAAGDPNTGKTNTVWLLVELARTVWDDLLVISNARAGAVDERVTSCHDLALTLLEHRDRPKAVVIDEGSTHFDARTNSYEVASQWSPLLKRMSKLGTEFTAVIGHTGKDVDPEVKRLTSLALYKSDPKVVEFYDTWPADSDRPIGQLFGGDLHHLEPTGVEYDPDEPAPWSWDLRSNLFALDLDWPELHAELRDRGPDT
ncbi:hypothetical protein GRS48_05490 [Halorubrum sp. JWXQ-INN 858]|uniref:hypothetical protein n=1 Tax=Halorubrum sp. JWXQ-INN 858 TaxID=2690782 RepID=UPI00135A0FAA|nr:hypothetical protein [Halorubrum sp. JWXQ-INN 858]MWV64279.1 hypothetical protein [Halorubrum sp. JWXQ-INN 858]